MNFIINRRIFIAMIFTALSMLGYISYKQLAVELYPNAELPMLFVNVSSQLEVDPSYMENQAVIPIEGAISTLEGIEEINSSAGSRQGTIQVSYSQSVNQKFAYLKLTEKIEEIKSKIPEEFVIQVLKFDLEQMNNRLMTLQVRGSGGVNRVRNITDKEIVEHLQNIDGIANAEVFGGREKSIEIILNEDVAKSYGITSGSIRTALSNNDKAREYAGKIIKNNRLHFVNVVAEFTDISDIYELEIRDGIKLKDVADIHYGYKKEESLSRVNGKESVTIEITRNSQTNIIELADAVKEKIDELNQKLGSQDIEIVIENNSAETIEDNIDLIIRLAIIGGALAIFILWIFLKNLRLVAAIALAIPISVYASFNFFYAFGITINSLTLLGMALAIGMLLDNSVVVLENIYRLASQKMKPEKAVIQGTIEVWRSIFAATLTTITVFLPFLFSSNFAISLLGKHIGVSIISTLLVSLLVALLLIPMITYVFLKIKQKSDKAYFDKIDPRNRLIQVYLVLLKTCMRYPARTIMSAIAIFFVVLLLSLAISVNTSEEAEITDITLYVTMPQGSTLEKTDALVTKAEEALADIEEKQDVISQIYDEEAVINIKLKEDFYAINNRNIPQIKEFTLRQLRHLREAEFSWEAPQTNSRFGNRGGGGGGFGGGGADSFARMLGIGAATESVIVKGQDYDKMLKFAEEIEYYLDELSSIDYVSVGSSRKQPELIVDFDKDIMALYNVRAASIASGLNSFQSEVSTGVYFKQGNEEYEILIKTLRTKAEETEDRNLEDLKRMEVQGDQGSSFEVQNISKQYFSEGLASIQRKNQEKQIELTYRFLSEINDDKDLLDDSRLEVDELIAGVKKPSGIAVEVIHEENQWDDFKLLFLMAIILIYMILASVFESFSSPFVMMFSIPLAAVGSMIALILTGNSLLNTNSLTGFLILLGIVVNNGIIMIDYTRILERRGYNQYRALMMAGMARVRPILITAITTTIALIPLALGETEYVAQIGVPFAITVIGGLIVSTILTLVFIPTLNSGVGGAIRWIGSRKTKWIIMYFIIWFGAGFYIYAEVDNQIFKVIYWLLLLILVPAGHYFILRSLRKSNENILGDDTHLHIRIRNLVKIYDRDNQFMREWKSGIRLRKRLGIEHKYKSLRDFSPILWQIPLLVFFVYLIYFHIMSAFWYFVLPVLLYIMIRVFLKPIREFSIEQKQLKKNKFARILINFIYKLIYWFMPIFVCVLSYLDYNHWFSTILVGTLWYLGILINYTSEKLYKNKVNVNRLKGRFKGIRKLFYRFVLSIPVIGKKKQPFKAIKQINIDIENGMFGLLGPNGAGKSTLMKIICGILDQSYGQITINGLDLQKNREELQGLIGYLPQEFGMYENMTAWQFLNYMGILKKLHEPKVRNERVEYVLHAVHMYENKDHKIGSFSGGMKQRIGIAMILLNLPRILVVDEPTAGLDPRERIRFRNLLVELSAERIVIFSTHIIEDVASSCQRVAVMKKGLIQYLGKPIDMAEIARGKVWHMNVDLETFERLKEKYTIVHHMRDENFIRVRLISNEKPSEDASLLKGNLEDAYLCLLTEK